ncbi:MAG: hypothetical protein IV094_17580 [Vitreoscilla sp.]|nr:hypothetical protein [Vitreoscilla sp.]
MHPHRIRQLRWQASAPDTGAAFALRARLHDATERVSAALERALDAIDPGDPALILHLRRMELALPPAALDADAAELDQIIRALVQREWEVLSVQRSTPAIPGPEPDLPQAVAMEQRLLDYLASGVLHWSLAGLEPERVRAGLRAAALALVGGDDPLRLGMRAGNLAERTGWFRRLLELWPEPERHRWMQHQVDAAQGHPMAAAPLHEALDRRLFDPGLPEPLRLQMMALWLAVMAPGAVSLDAHRREQDLQDAERLLERWLCPALPLPLEMPTAPPQPPWRAAEPTPLRAPPGSAEQADAGPGWMVPMAGLLLLHPWLPSLFQRCGVIARADTSLLDEAALARASGLLVWLATGRDEAPELDLPFVKLLLGQRPDTPWVGASQPPDETERREGEALLLSVIGHWEVLKGTGVDALRASFLQRRGLLSERDGRWLLRPQPEAFDLLLARLPWGISWVRLPWMPAALATEWGAT